MASVVARALTIFFIGAFGVAAVSVDESSLRGRSASSFIRNLEFHHILRICNAFPYEAGLEISVGQDKLTSSPLEYTDCAEYKRKLNAGDKVDFKIDDSSVGTFTLSDLPAGDAVMLMVIYRHDTLSTAVAFESHIFAKLPSAQIAVIDAYKGSKKADILIDVKQNSKKDEVSRSEQLRYSSVVAVNPGVYEVELADAKSKVASKQLVAVPDESYLVARIGVEAQEGKSYPQDIIVFPNHKKADLGAAAPSHGASRVALTAAALTCLLAATWV